MALTDRKPQGFLKALLRAPIWLYRAGMGRILGHRLFYIAHQGRRTGARREVVVETVRYDPTIPEVVVVAAWGKDPDWYRNLTAAPALETCIGGKRWERPHHRFLDADETLQALRAYQRQHPRAWKRVAPVLGFPADISDPSAAGAAGTVHAIAFTPTQA